MQRDLDKFNHWKQWNLVLQLKEFEKKKLKVINDAQGLLEIAIKNGVESEIKGARHVLEREKKMRFEFDKSSLLHYGQCSKFKKEVVFIPDTCQVHTQDCFVNRKTTIVEDMIMS